MDRKEIEHCIKTQRFNPRSLWCVFNKKVDRSNMRIDFGWWDGPGEYKAVEFLHKNEIFFISTTAFNKLRKTCQDCGESLRDDNNFLKEKGSLDVYICDNCGSHFESQYESTLKKIEHEKAI